MADYFKFIEIGIALKRGIELYSGVKYAYRMIKMLSLAPVVWAD
jgi:hypothetical protein